MTERFNAIRKRIFKMIADQLAIDPYCKSYEGWLELNVEYPDYFEDNNAEQGPRYYKIKLHCYVLGPARHYDFKGRTMDEALDRLEKALDSWENADEWD